MDWASDGGPTEREGGAVGYEVVGHVMGRKEVVVDGEQNERGLCGRFFSPTVDDEPIYKDVMDFVSTEDGENERDCLRNFLTACTTREFRALHDHGVGIRAFRFEGVEEGDDGVMNRLMPFGVCFGESVASDSGADGQDPPPSR